MVTVFRNNESLRRKLLGLTGGGRPLRDFFLYFNTIKPPSLAFCVSQTEYLQIPFSMKLFELVGSISTLQWVCSKMSSVGIVCDMVLRKDVSVLL